ncbi:DUF6543 domain-containing protein [Pseudomonas sp. SIMBA_077]
MTLTTLNVPERPPALLSANLWAQQEALAFMAATMKTSFSGFDTAQIKQYIALQRKAQTALSAVETEHLQFRETFQNTHLAILKRELKALTGEEVDPLNARLYTRYLEIKDKQERTPLDILSDWIVPEPSKNKSRPRRALDTSDTVAHVRSISLWEAACSNFGFSTDSIFLKPFSYVEASYIHYGPSNKTVDVKAFIALVRRLDFGSALSTLLVQAMAPDGQLSKRLNEYSKATFEFELLEAYRNSAVSGVTKLAYDRLLNVFNDQIACNVHSVTMTPSAGALFVERVPLSLVILHFDGEPGVYSYFPHRPGGALRYHPQRTEAKAQFKQQLKRSHLEKNLGWFAAQLSLPDIREFQKLLSDEPRPVGMSWLAGKLYDGFHAAFKEPTLDSLVLEVEPVANPRQALVNVLGARQVSRYKANLNLLASRRSTADWEALKEVMQAIGQEVLSLLTTPVPGGVTGLNKVMQITVFGSLGYSLVKGVLEASRGDAREFGSALADIADLLVSGWLIGLGGKLHRKRMNALWQQMGQPRKVIFEDGKEGLWRPDLNTYSQVHASTLDSLAPNAQGIYEVNNKLYAKVHDGELQRAVEIIYDTREKQYVLKTTEPHSYRPGIQFDTAQQVWRLVLDDTAALSDAQWLQRMLPFDASQVALKDIELMLRITATTRAQLDSIWQGQSVPGPLADGVRRLRVEQQIKHIIDDLPLRGEMPANADFAVFALLTQLQNWPTNTVLDVYDQQGVKIESYGLDHRPGTELQHIEVKRLDHGSYVARHDETQGAAGVEQLFTLIVDQLPADSSLGREGNPTASKASRIALIREHISTLAKTEHAQLFQAMTLLEGHQRSDPAASHAPGNKFLPLLYPPFSARTSALIAKLHTLNTTLSVACIEQLLLDHPFTERQIQGALEHNRQPIPFSEAADRLKIQVRIDLALDGIYHTRAYTPDSDLWAREFAKGLLNDKFDRYLVVTELGDPENIKLYVSTGPNDTTVELRHYGRGVYRVSDFRNGGEIRVPESSDSLYLAIASVLQPHERTSMGMQHATDAAGMRKTLGDAMTAMRQPTGEVRLWENTIGQFVRDVRLPRDLKPDGLGLYEIDGKKYLPLAGSIFQVEFDSARQKWRVKHPSKVGVDAPTLVHNHEGAWRVSNENPLQWEGLSLLRRLRTDPVTFNDAVGKQIMAVSNTDEAVLRQVHMNNRSAPPLLIDTWKRFDIEAEIQSFVRSMQEHYSLRTARTDIQLLLLQSLPGWPRDKVLQIIDAQGTTLAEYGADLSPDVPRISISQSDASNGSFLRALLMRLGKEDTQTLLGSYDPVIEQRMLALAKKIAAHALKRKPQLFKSLYEKQETSSDPHVQLIQKHEPQLPLSVIKDLLSHATSHEKNEYLNKGDIAPRVKEQIPWSVKEVRLVRAYEGLYLGATATPDSEKLTLHMLQALPGWPGHIAIDVFNNTLNGTVLDSIGAADASTRYRLVKRDEQYLAYSSEAQALNTLPEVGNNLLSSILHVLSDTERSAMGLKDVNDSQTLATKIADLAKQHRAKAKTLLGLDKAKPWFSPPINVNTSFIAYPLFARLGHGDHSNDLIRKAIRLYPRMARDDISQLLNTLGGNEAARQQAVERLRVEYQTLQNQLEAWSGERLRPVSADHVRAVDHRERAHITDRILSAWRRELDRGYSQADEFIGYKLDLSWRAVGDLPALQADFSHIGALAMDSMGLFTGSSDFLSCFTGLRWLSMRDNHLSAIPPAVLSMTGLTRLNLSRNLIVLTPDAVQALGNLTTLKDLSLDFNPLGLAPDVTRMPDLRGLSLRSTGIATWPTGVLELPHIEVLDLRSNQIISIPHAVFEVPDTSPVNRGTQLHDNPLNTDSRNRLNAYRVSTQINMGIITHRAHVNVRDSFRRDVDAWLSPNLPDSDKTLRTRQWELLKREGRVAEDFFRLINDMTKARDYLNRTTQPQLKERVWDMINVMLESTELRREMLDEKNFATTCSDGAMVIFDNLEVITLAHHVERVSTEQTIAANLLDLAKRLFRLRQVDQAVRDDIKERYKNGGEPDEAEVQLFYRIALAEPLNLPIKTRSMHHAPIAGVSDDTLKRTKDRVLGLEGTPAMQYSITTEESWLKYLRRQYAGRFKFIEDGYLSKLEVLADQKEALGTEEYNKRGAQELAVRTQADNALIAELTVNEQSAVEGIDITYL